MVRLHKVLIFTVLIMLFAACEKSSDSGGESSVSIETSGIEDPVSIYVDDSIVKKSYDLDEYVKGGDPLTFLVKVKNNSKFEIFNLNLQFLNNDITNYNFSTNDLGLKQFPGKNG